MAKEYALASLVLTFLSYLFVFFCSELNCSLLDCVLPDLWKYGCNGASEYCPGLTVVRFS